MGTGIVLNVVFGEGFPEEMAFRLNPMDEKEEGLQRAQRTAFQEWERQAGGPCGGRTAFCVQGLERKNIVAGM